MIESNPTPDGPIPDGPIPDGPIPDRPVPDRPMADRPMAEKDLAQSEDLDITAADNVASESARFKNASNLETKDDTELTQKETRIAAKFAARKQRSLAEWMTLTVSMIVLASVVGLVLYDWQISKNMPPAFQIELAETPRLTEGRYYVPFTLKNTGGRIARTVQVMAELQLADGSEETGEQQFDFLSVNERKKGGFVFNHNPQSGNLIVRVASFGLP
jgi:uncharacterized protein (TIGR02588 family)